MEEFTAFIDSQQYLSMNLKKEAKVQKSSAAICSELNSNKMKSKIRHHQIYALSEILYDFNDKHSHKLNRNCDFGLFNPCRILYDYKIYLFYTDFH